MPGRRRPPQTLSPQGLAYLRNFFTTEGPYVLERELLEHIDGLEWVIEELQRELTHVRGQLTAATRPENPAD